MRAYLTEADDWLAGRLLRVLGDLGGTPGRALFDSLEAVRVAPAATPDEGLAGGAL